VLLLNEPGGNISEEQMSFLENLIAMYVSFFMLKYQHM
jgi:hypothetical protein